MTLREWLEEQENYSTRVERLCDDTKGCDAMMILKWVQAAYSAGYEEGRKK